MGCHGFSRMHTDEGPRRSVTDHLVQLETEGLGELSLVEVEGVETVDAEFEGGCHVQQVGGAGA